MIQRTLGFIVLFAFAAVALGIVDPELQICRHQCRVQTGFDLQQQQACLDKCERYRREKEGREEEHGGSSGERGREGNNPYVFQPRHFQTEHSSQQGRFSALPRFTERSNLFEGIENFRVGILEVESKTFVAPNHLDADLIAFVAEGTYNLHTLFNLIYSPRTIYNVYILSSG